MTARPRRRWLQFSLRTFLIVLTLLAMGLGYISFRVREQQAAVARIEELGGYIQYDYQRGTNPKPNPPGWPWLRRVLGDDYFRSVCFVKLEETQVSDADLRLIGKLRHTEIFSLDRTNISDQGLESIRGMSDLKHLNLSKTKVTTQGIRRMHPPKKGSYLALAEADVGDEALANLSECGCLVLDGTPVTSQGIQKLTTFRNLRSLSIQQTSVDDAAVPFLVQIVTLEELHVSDTKISGEGLLALRDAFPKIWFVGNWADLSGAGPLDSEIAKRRWKQIALRMKLLNNDHWIKLLVLSNLQVTDSHLTMFEELDHLETLDLRGSSVTDAGVQKLQKALPKLKIHR